MSIDPIDSSSSLFIHSSGIPRTSLVHVPFSGTGFGGWKRGIVVSLSAKNKIGLIDGSYTRPAEGQPNVAAWDRCNNKVISWLTSSLSPEIAESVQYSETAESIWEQLNKRYGTVNGTKVFEVKRELASTSQGALDIASYFNKLKKLWGELAAMCKNHSSACTCASKEGAYSILLQDERQRQVSPNTQFSSEMASFHAKLFNSKTQFNKPQFNAKPIQYPQPQRQLNQRVNFDQYNHRVNSDQNKDSLSCTYYKKTNHTIKKCHRLHGYPPNFKFNKTKKFGTAATVEATSNLISECSSFGSIPFDQEYLVPGLNKDQSSQLFMLLQQCNLADSNANPQSNFVGSANFAGSYSPLPEFNSVAYSSCMFTSVGRSIWIVDSGATDHMTSDKNLLFDIIPLSIPYLVTLPNGYKVNEEASAVLDKAAVGPDLTILALNNVANSMHAIPSVALNKSVNSTSLPPISSVQSMHNVNNTDVIWHYKLRHISFVRMKYIPSISSELPSKQSFVCHICLLARQGRLPFPTSSTHSTSLFQLIHIDTWGPYHTQTYSGAKYFLTIVDDYNRATWTHLLNSKSVAFPLLKAFIFMVQTHFKLPVQTIRSDNALELDFSAIASQFSPILE
ncbi:uncharacterized protein LOC132039123 [Lycium ferocissimum]|uniref:uncharacterized protein LOC132039123 n=1 Tax=Lycium ferocissimum TaxID=112874 RepID=UPI002815B1F2|nr:uncharacterized protein LOC132039123 [Lycium ferocissimum]